MPTKKNETTVRNFSILLFCILSILPTYGQTISERLVLRDTEDSLFLKVRTIVFDREGNYCLVIKDKDQEFLVSKQDTLGGFRYVGTTHGSNGEVSYTHSYLEEDDKPYYYKNRLGTKIYGMAVGKIENYQTSGTREHMAIVTTLNDSVYYYVNGKRLVHRLREPDKYYGTEDDWVAFSENGNTIYAIKPDSLTYLYVNDRLIDSSRFSYIQLAINNEGSYLYAKGKRPEKPIPRYDYMFYIHTQDTVFGYVRTVWDYALKENGAYYYSSNDNGPYYVAINGQYYKNLKDVGNIILIDKNTYLYSFRKYRRLKIKKKSKIRLNVNGEMYAHKFDTTLSPILDSDGNFALYGIRKKRVYKYINGKKEKEPISKYGLRTFPIYISPKGESIHYFISEDSLYLYRDEELIFAPKPRGEGGRFSVKFPKEFLPDYPFAGKTKTGNALFYVEYGKKGYFLYKGRFSYPVIPYKPRYYSNKRELGTIVAGRYNSHGFFVIQKTAEKKHLIIINNEIYKEIEGIDFIVSDSYFFDAKTLIFYGYKDHAFYQFSMSL